MSKQTINIGASPNDGTGTPLRTSFDYTNQNFTELYTALGGGVGLPGATTQVIFNDGGTNLAGDAGLVYNKTTDALTVGGLVTAGSATITGDLTVDTNVLKVDTTNNRVGIGTATPATRLDVNGGTGGIGGQTHATFSGTAGRGLVISTRSDSASADRSGVFDAPFTGGTLAFQTLSTDRMVIDASANVNITSGNVVMATSGKGIDFSATAGTGTSELLNDYEEGTWTGTMTGSTTNPTVPVTATGKYTKIGRQVTVVIYFANVSTVGASGAVGITGLPFTEDGTRAVGTAGFYNFDFNGGTGPFVDVSGAAMFFQTQLTNSNWRDVNHSAGVGRYLRATATYNV